MAAETRAIRCERVSGDGEQLMQHCSERDTMCTSEVNVVFSDPESSCVVYEGQGDTCTVCHQQNSHTCRVHQLKQDASPDEGHKESQRCSIVHAIDTSNGHGRKKSTQAASKEWMLVMLTVICIDSSKVHDRRGTQAALRT
jgi:hypothetical protein